MHLFQAPCAKSRADFPSILEPRIPIIKTNKQRSKARPGAAGVCETANHELFIVNAFHLQPVRSATGPVGLIASLADHSFQMKPTCMLFEFLAAPRNVL